MKHPRPVRIRATDTYVVFKLPDELDQEHKARIMSAPIGELARQGLAAIVRTPQQVG